MLNVGRYVGPGGLNIGALATFCFVWGMGGAFISLQMSRWIAKRATGMTFTQYLSMVRIAKAKKLLANPQARITEVAYAAGFAGLPERNKSV